LDFSLLVSSPNIIKRQVKYKCCELHVEKYYGALSGIATVKMTMVPDYVAALKFGERSSQLRKVLVRGRCSKRLTSNNQ